MYRSEKPDKGTIVYVGGLTSEVKKEDLEREFEKFGKLTRVWVAFNPPGFAFVEFLNKEDAEAACDNFKDSMVFGSKLKVEISRGRGKGGRGGMSGNSRMNIGERGSFRGGRDNFRGGRGNFRGGRDDFMGRRDNFRGVDNRDDFRGGLDHFRGDLRDFLGDRGNDYGRGRGRGLSRGRSGFGDVRPFERDNDFQSFRDERGRFDDLEDRRRAELDSRDYVPRRGELGGSGLYGDVDSTRPFDDDRDLRIVRSVGGYEGNRNITERDFASREIGGRAFDSREVNVRDYGPRDIDAHNLPPRNTGEREFSRRVVERDYTAIGNVRDFPVDQDLNGSNRFGSTHDLGLSNREYPGAKDFERSRDFGAAQLNLSGREVGIMRDIPINREIGDARDFGERNLGARDFGGIRDIGLRRESSVRDFNPPRDIGNPRDFVGRPSRMDFADNDRFGGGSRGSYDDIGMRRGSGFESGRYPGGDVDGYGGYGARDRFRSRSPIGRVSRQPY